MGSDIKDLDRKANKSEFYFFNNRMMQLANTAILTHA